MARVRRKWTAEEDTLLRAAVKSGKFQVQVLRLTSRYLRDLLKRICPYIEENKTLARYRLLSWIVSSIFLSSIVT